MAVVSMIFLVLLNTTIFVTLALIHFYWAFGGKRWIRAALPQRQDGSLLFVPGVMATVLVGVGLLLFSFIALANLHGRGLIHNNVQYGNIFVAAVFAFRAIGDFNVVGFTRKVRNTLFAQRDTQIYSPLCLVIAIVMILITVLGG